MTSWANKQVHKLFILGELCLSSGFLVLFVDKNESEWLSGKPNVLIADELIEDDIVALARAQLWMFTIY